MKILLILTFLISFCQADSPATPFDYIASSPNGQFTIVIFSDESNPNWSVVKREIRDKYKTPGIYNADGILISKINTHMWGAFVTNSGIGFGMGPWAHKGNFDEVGFFVCKNNSCTGIKVKEFIDNPDDLPKSVSHYSSIFTVKYDQDLEAVIFITYEYKAIVYNAKTGDPGDIRRWPW